MVDLVTHDTGNWPLINIPLSSFVSATYRDFRIFVPSLILIKVILVFFGSLSFRIIVYQPPENH